MNARLQHYLVLAVVVSVASLTGARAEEPARSAATPIIFSAPRSDTVSSNLNQIGAKSSPLLDLESGLTKPFEIFDTKSSRSLRPASKDMRYVPPAPVLSNKKLKDLLDKRAEEMYLTREDNETALTREDLLKSDEDPLDPSGKRLKTPLDRYYDRIDRMKLGPTNQTPQGLELFGNKTGPDDKDELKSKPYGGLFASELSPTARSLERMSNGSSGGGFLSSEKAKDRSFGDIFGLGPVESSKSVTGTRESRLDEFKRLLDGPGYGSRGDFNVTPPAAASSSLQAPKPVGGVPSPVFSATPPPLAGGGHANSPGFAGTVGTPVGVPDFAVGTPSLTPTAPVQKPKPLPPPTFNVPRRRF
ncbi:MAG: hypothetical protein U1F83_12065 [Verrucomicrobiota bacterium]